MFKNNKEQLWSRGQEIVAAAPQVYVDVDVEADGIAGHGSMLSIGAQSVGGEAYYSEIQPASEMFIPSNRRFAESIGLERERLMDEARPLQEVMGELYEWTTDIRTACGKRAIFAANNAGFDWGHTDLYFAKAGLENPYGVAPFDIKSLLIAYNNSWNWSTEFPSEIVPDEEFTHHALEDAQYQQKLHFGMAALLGMKYGQLE